MIIYGNGYSTAQFDNTELRRVVEKLKIAIPHYLAEASADGIVVTGKSGLSMAFATLSHIDFPLVTVRKDGETSHGQKIEGTAHIDYKRLLVLDDFVATGDTIRAIERAFHDHAVHRRVAIVGVLAWADGGGSIHLKETQVHIYDTRCSIPFVEPTRLD